MPGAAASRASGAIPGTLLQFSACFCLLFGLSGSPKCFALLPTLPCILLLSIFPFCVSHFLAFHSLLLYSSHAAFFPLFWENCTSKSPSTQQPVSVFGDPLCSASSCSSSVLSMGLSMRLPLPMLNFLHIRPLRHCFLNCLCLHLTCSPSVCFISSCLSSPSLLFKFHFNIFIHLVC